MIKINKLIIIKNNEKKDYIKIIYYFDFKVFYNNNDFNFYIDDILKIIKKWCYDVVVIILKSVSVYYNKEEIIIKDFKDYMNLYFEKDVLKVYFKINEWEIGVVRNIYNDDLNISYVNGICIDDGGIYVKYILN